MNKKNVTRREFIERSTAGALGATLGAGLSGEPTDPEKKKRPEIKSKVVLVRHPRVVDGSGAVEQSIFRGMLDTALTGFTGKESASDAWREFVSPGETVGLKISTIALDDIEGTPATTHFPCMTDAIIAGCGKAGIGEKQFLIWDRSEEELQRAGYAIQKSAGKLRVMGTKVTRRGEEGIGFGAESFPVGDKSTRVSRILSELCDACINVPLLKNHRIAGVTGALKNHYGSIDNAREFHENFCTGPGIPEINTVPVIRDKQRLIVVDALLGIYEGGPRWERRYMWAYGGILVGTDPVAVDRVLLTILNEKRASMKLEPIEESTARHLKLSEELGLGVSTMDRIDLVKIDLE